MSSKEPTEPTPEQPEEVAAEDNGSSPEAEASSPEIPISLAAPLWHYLGYGLAAGAVSVIIWAAVPLMPNDGAFLSLLFVVVFFTIVAIWIKLLQWLAEKICGIPFRKRHIILSLLAGYLASAALMLITLALPVPVVIITLLGFALGSGLTILYFANPGLGKS